MRVPPPKFSADSDSSSAAKSRDGEDEAMAGASEVKVMAPPPPRVGGVKAAIQEVARKAPKGTTILRGENDESLASDEKLTTERTSSKQAPMAPPPPRFVNRDMQKSKGSANAAQHVAAEDRRGGQQLPSGMNVAAETPPLLDPESSNRTKVPSVPPEVERGAIRGTLPAGESELPNPQAAHAGAVAPAPASSPGESAMHGISASGDKPGEEQCPGTQASPAADTCQGEKANEGVPGGQPAEFAGLQPPAALPGTESAAEQVAPPAPPAVQPKPGGPPYVVPPWSAKPGVAYSLEVLKEGSVIENLNVCEKGAYMFGRSERCDVVMEHPTTSRFHAVIQHKSTGQAYVMDLATTHGTFLNKRKASSQGVG
eukprot:jgi/Mesen1/9585/ME000656S08851